jgi:heme oxygenase
MNSPNDFMNQLRSETSVIHRQLEETTLSKSVMAPVVATDDYAAYLQTMLAIHQSIEEQVFPVVATLFPEIDQRRKTALIVQDLEQLGFDTAQISNAITFTDRHYRNDLAFNLGILYVSEGSTLGGRVIMKNVIAAAKPGIAEACNFLDCYGDTTGSRWKTFLAVLQQYQETADEATRSSIIDGANYGFGRTAALFNTASIEL